MASLPSYDPTNAPSLSLTPTAGTVTISGPGPYPWVESSLPVTLTKFIEIGLEFDFGVSNESEQGLALAPRRPFTNATNDLAGTGETPEVWTLTLTTNLGAPSAVPNLYLVRVPAEWTGTSNTPYLNRTGATSEDESVVIEDLAVNSATWVLNGSTYDLVWEFDFHTTGYFGSSSSPSATITDRVMFGMVNSPTWTGLFQFHLDASSALSMEISAATFAGQTLNWHTGFIDAKMNVRGRAVHDYKTGQPMMSQDAVEDGYLDGILVHPDNYDPADPLDDDPFTPPPGEGVVDDNIIDLE